MFGICKYTFLIFEKRGMSETVVLDFLRFVSILFYYLKRGYRDV